MSQKSPPTPPPGGTLAFLGTAVFFLGFSLGYLVCHAF